MPRKIVSTSTSSLYNLDVNHDIDLIRLRLYINNVEFIDGININNQRLQHLMTNMDSSAVFTSPAPEEDVINLFTKLYQQGYDEVFVTTCSSALSESHKIIKRVADTFKDRMYIYVYDCKELNICEAMLALEAKHMTENGYSMPEIAQRLDKLRQNHKMLLTVNSLVHLIKNKKLSATAGFFANLLNIKPVIQVTDEGKIIAVKKIRSVDKALNYIIDEFKSDIQNTNYFAYVLSTGHSKLDEKFVSLIKQRTPINNISVLPVSTISLANQGPTGVGLCLFSEELPYAAKYYE